MTTDPLSFLEGEPSGSEDVQARPEAPAPEPRAAPPQEAEGAAETPRGPDGKFTSQTPPEPPHAVAEGDAKPQPPLSEKETVGFYKAMQEERDKRQAAEKRARELQDRIDAQSRPTEPLPLEAQVEARLYEQNLKTSRRFAETQYGKDEVAKVHDWASARCDADPIFNQQMRASDHPYEEAMQAFNRERIVAEVSAADLDAFKAWKAAQAEVQAQAAPNPSPAAPPRSLATASGTGGLGMASIPVHAGAAFEALPFN